MRFIPTGQPMTQKLAGVRSPSQRATNALIFTGILLASAFLASEASAQALSYAPDAAKRIPIRQSDARTRAER